VLKLLGGKSLTFSPFKAIDFLMLSFGYFAYFPVWLAAWLSGNALCLINQVTVRRPGQVSTAMGR